MHQRYTNSDYDYNNSVSHGLSASSLPPIAEIIDQDYYSKLIAVADETYQKEVAQNVQHQC